MFLTFANVLPFGLSSTNSYGWILVQIVVGILVRTLVVNLERILVDTALPSPNLPNQSCILELCPVYYVLLLLLLLLLLRCLVNYNYNTTTTTTLSCQMLPPPTVQAAASQAINTRLAMRAPSQQNQLSEAAIS